ncbi:MAG: gliding motility-associated C-terminal domain-containing protein [Bacteroidota bacterium]
MKNLILSVVLVLAFPFTEFATHIVGGNFVIVQTSPNTFNITVKVYRDCCATCTDMPTSITVGIYDKVTNTQVQTVTISTPALSNIVLGDECYTPTGICVQEGIFTQNGVIIANNSNGYYLQTELFARNNIIANIQNPGGTGMAFYAEIPDPAISGMNSSPDFGPYPSDGYFCVNNTKLLDFSVTDPDGDSLVYSLVDPLQSVQSFNGTSPAPYSPVTWQSPYSLANICGGTPPMSCNSVTGIVDATPSALGTYVFAVRIEEYRNSVKIGEVRRDVQYHALSCVFDDLPEIMLPDSLFIEIFTEGCFDIAVIDADATDTVSILVTSPTMLMGATVGLPAPYTTSPDTTYMFHYIDETTGQPDSIVLDAPTMINGAFYGIGGVGLRYCWQTDCEDVPNSPYLLDVAAFSLGCSGDTNFINQQVVLEVGPPSSDFEVVPNVFSPNGDGFNDVFQLGYIPNVCDDYIHVEIYNRWGQKVFESDEVEFKWDGKNQKGNDLPSGVYYVLLSGVYGDTDVTSQYSLTLFREK